MKNASYDVVAKAISAIKEAEIEPTVEKLSLPQCDVLMKYLYRGLGQPSKKTEVYSVCAHARALSRSYPPVCCLLAPLLLSRSTHDGYSPFSAARPPTCALARRSSSGIRWCSSVRGWAASYEPSQNPTPPSESTQGNAEERKSPCACSGSCARCSWERCAACGVAARRARPCWTLAHGRRSCTHSHVLSLAASPRLRCVSSVCAKLICLRSRNGVSPPLGRWP